MYVIKKLTLILFVAIVFSCQTEEIVKIYPYPKFLNAPPPSVKK